MTVRTEFGVRLPNSGPFATAENILQLAERAQALTFGSVWVHDHISWTRDKLTHFAAGSVEACKDQDPNFFESLTSATAVGMHVKNVQVGIAGMALPLRDPRILAKQIAAADHFIGADRLIIAFGVGAIKNDFEVMGVRWDRRGRIATDHAAALRAILDGEQPVAFESQTLGFKNGAFYPKPRKVNLWFAGGSEAARRRTAKYGDGWLVSPNGFPHKDEFQLSEYAAAVRQMRQFLVEEGRSADDFPIALEVYISVAKTDQAAIDIASHTLEHRFKSVKRGLAETIVGSSQTFTDRVKAFHEAGVRRFEVKFICHDTTQMAAMMEQVAEAIAKMGDLDARPQESAVPS